LRALGHHLGGGIEGDTGNGTCLRTLCRRFAARRIQRTGTQGSQSLALGLATSATRLISAPTGYWLARLRVTNPCSLLLGAKPRHKV